MKKTVLFTITLIFLFPFLSFTQNYDLNTVVTQNDRVAGGTFKIRVDVRAIGSSFQVGRRITGGNNSGRGQILVRMNFDTLTVQFVSGTMSSNWANLTQRNDVSLNNNGNRVRFRARARNDSEEATVNTGWQEVGEVTFTILDPSRELGIQVLNNAILSYFDSPPTTYVLGEAFNSVVYNGGWSGGNGPGGAPNNTDAAKELIIQSADSVVLTENAELEYISISGGGKLTIDPGVSLGCFVQSTTPYTGITKSSFIVDADANGENGYAQFYGAPVDGEFRQYVGTYLAWRNFTFPTNMDSLSMGAFQNNYTGGTSARCTPNAAGDWGNYKNTTNFYEFTSGLDSCGNTDEHEYSGLTGVPAGGANGYFVYLGGQFQTTGIVRARGTSVISTTYNYTHTTPHADGTGSQGAVNIGTPAENDLRKANWDGWRIVGNPFACNLNVAQWLSDNGISGTPIRVYDQNTKTYYDVSTGTVAPFQSFWIKFGTDGTNQTLNFNSDHRTLTRAAWLKTTNNPHDVTISVQERVFGGQHVWGYPVSVYFDFDQNAQNGYDLGMDGYSRDNKVDHITEFSLANTYINQQGTVVSAPLSNNAIPLPVSPEVYPLNFKANKNGIYKFSKVKTMPQGYELFIEDTKRKKNKIKSLTKKFYKIKYSASDDINRFKLHIVPTSYLVRTVNVNEAMDESEILAWFGEDQLHIDVRTPNGISSQLQIQVYDLMGHLLLNENRTNIEGGILSLPFHGDAGVYVIHIVRDHSDNPISIKSIKR